MRLCPHLWYTLTGENVYGKIGSKHFGEYKGISEEECRLCGKVRRTSAEHELRDAQCNFQRAKQELEEAQSRMQKELIT